MSNRKKVPRAAHLGVQVLQVVGLHAVLQVLSKVGLVLLGVLLLRSGCGSKRAHCQSASGSGRELPGRQPRSSSAAAHTRRCGGAASRGLHAPPLFTPLGMALTQMHAQTRSDCSLIAAQTGCI